MLTYLLLVSTLTGTVLDETSRPIEGAVVVLIPGSFGADPATSTSDAKGRFELAIPKAGPYRVEAYAPGYAPFQLRDVVPDKPLSIVLQRGGETIEGVVRDGTTMDPLDGAVVETRTSEDSRRVYAEPRLGVVAAVSDDRGSFRLEGLAKGAYSVSASAPGYGQTTKHDVSPGESVELFLFPGTGVYGRILDGNGAPVEGAWITSEPRERGSQWSTAQRSDAEGRFAFLGLEPGGYRLFVHHEDFAPAAQDVELAKESDTEVELVLTAGVTLTGRLIDENDEPVTGKVSLRALDGGSVGLMMRSRFRGETDAQGLFSFGPLPTGDHILLVEARGYGSKNVEALVSGRFSREDLGDIVLETGLAISGRVVDENRAPIVAAVVNAAQPARGMMSATGDFFVATETDEQGRFILGGLSPGAHHVQALAPGYGRSERILMEPGASGLTLTLKVAGSIRGTVVDPEGRPVTSFQAMARSPDYRGTPMSMVRDAEGGFTLEAAEGEYAVEIVSPDFMPEAVSSVVVSRGNVTELGTIRLRHGGSIAGTVVDSSAEPVPGATIQAFAPGQRMYQWTESAASSDRLGRFQIRGLTDGKVSVVASHPSFAEARLDNVEVGSRSGASVVEIVLSRGGALEGVVRTRDGTDVAGRTIEVHPQWDRMSPWSSQRARTSDDGTFRIEHLPAGKLTAALQHTEVDSTFTVQSREVEIAEGETTYVEFHARPVLVQGQVRRGGSPLSGVEIELWPQSSGFSSTHGGIPVSGPPPAGPRYLMGMSGDDGYYELLVGEPGEYHLSASASGVGLPWRNVTIPDVESLSLDLDFGGALVSGRVVDKKTEAPIGGAFVMARSTKPTAVGSGATQEVGPDGLFELELEPGDFAIVARAEGYATAEQKVALSEGGRSDLVFALSSGLGITGRVLDANGRGLANLRVVAIEDSSDISTPPTRMGVAMTIPDGSFRLDDLAPGRYNLLAGADPAGFAFLASVPAGTEDLELVLRPGGRVEVQVVDAEGAPVADAIVAVAAIEGRKVRGAQGRTDESGRLELAAPRGNLTIKAAIPDGPDGMAIVSLAENQKARVEIVLAQTASSLSKK